MRKLWIDNQSQTGADGIRTVIDPATEEVIGEVSWGTVEDADRAVSAAKKAFISGAKVGDALVTHPDVRMIAFTGSTETGQQIMRQAATDVKHIHLELGGKDPVIVCADADLEAAARGTVWGAFLNAGQVCTSIERAYVERKVYQQFLDRVVKLSRNLVIGPGIDLKSEVTPMILEQ